MEQKTIPKYAPALFWTQGIFYLMTGLWPLADRQRFELVTGPKTDYWLVTMVAALSLAVAVMLFEHALTRRNNVLPAALFALAFLSVDLWYVYRDVISRIYLVDAAAELVFLLLAIACFAARPRAARGPGDAPHTSAYRR